MLRAIFIVSALIWNIYGQSGSAGDVYQIGPGISAPAVIQQFEPQYSPEAQAAEIQGTVIFQLLVDEQGQATNIKVVNPLGFGLDELGQAAIQRWRFQPAAKDGKAVKVAAAIEVHFGLKGRLSREKRRNELGRALQQLQNEPKQKEHALRKIQDLAKEKLPDAMYMLGQLLAEGKELPPDPDRSRDLIAGAAEAKFGPAMFALARSGAEQKARGLESTKETIRNAANLGSTRAQYFLAAVYEKGSTDFGAPQDDAQALPYYRLCAAAGTMQCQFRLGELMLDGHDGEHPDIVEAIAWLELAADQGETRARATGSRARNSLSAEQIARVLGLKQRLVNGVKLPIR